jgi:hypothetical protein
MVSKTPHHLSITPSSLSAPPQSSHAACYHRPRRWATSPCTDLPPGQDLICCCFRAGRIVSMGKRWSHHLMKGPYDCCSIWHSGVASLASFLVSVLTKIPLFNVCPSRSQEILRCNGRGQIHMIAGLHQTFLGRKIVWYFRSLKWKWERLVSGMEHTHPANKEWTAPLGGFFDSSTGCAAHHSQLCARYVLLICCVADGYRSRVDMWQHFMTPPSRLGGWSLDYVCERRPFGRVIEIEAIRAHEQGKPLKLLDLLRPMADPDVGNIQLATVNNPRGPPCEEEKALYIAVVREQVLRTLKHALAKRQKHALAKKEKRDRKYLQMQAKLLRKGKQSSTDE